MPLASLLIRVVSFTTINMLLVRTPHNRIHLSGHGRAAVACCVASFCENRYEEQLSHVPGLGRGQSGNPGEKPVKRRLLPEAVALPKMMRRIHF